MAKNVLTIYDEVYDYFYDIIDVRGKNKFPYRISLVFWHLPRF